MLGVVLGLMLQKINMLHITHYLSEQQCSMLLILHALAVWLG